MKLGIVTDSPADLDPNLASRHNILIVPAALIIEGQSYTDGVDITREQFYTRLPAMRTPPTTAAPAPAEFSSRYQSLLEAGYEHVLSIHTSERLTAIANIARSVAAEFGARVTVLDSASLTMGVGFQALSAFESAAAGKTLPEILEAIESTRQRVRVAAAFETMDYLRRSGRIPGAITALGGLLNIKPVIEIRQGQIHPVGAGRTTRQATDILRNFLLNLGPLERLAILHTNAPERAQEFAKSLMESDARQSMPRDIGIVNVSTVIGTHVGPNGLGIAAVKA